MEVENLIFYLINLLNSRDENKKKKKLYIKKHIKHANHSLQSSQLKLPHKKNLIILIMTKINLINARNYNYFIYIMQFDIKKLEIYTQAMQKLNAT